MKNKNLTFRNANTQEAKNIYEILIKSFEPYKKYYTDQAFNATAISTKKIKNRILKHEYDVLVAIINKKIVGTISLSKKNQDFLYISSMAVHPNFQHRGIGRFILHNIELIAEKEGIKKIVLDSYKPLYRAIIFYKKFGFKRSGITKDFYGIEIFEMIKEID